MLKAGTLSLEPEASFSPFGLKERLVTIKPMKKNKPGPIAFVRKKMSARANLVWGFLAAVVWAAQVVRLHDSSSVFPFSLLLKGLVLVGAAAAVYHFSVFKKGFSFLGMFPLLWLALSQFQWDLCASPDLKGWLWLVLFLLGEYFIFSLADGRVLLAALAPLWAWLTWLSPLSWILPLGFLTAPKGRIKNNGWVKFGGVILSVVFFALLKGWQSPGLESGGVLDFLFTRRYAAFFLLGWLGLTAFPQRGTFRYAVTPVFYFMLGYLGWPASATDPLQWETLEWVVVFCAGFGWESFRRDLMDDSWHGRAVWIALGISLFGAFLR